jgi:uncharacterized membrane protein
MISSVFVILYMLGDAIEYLRRVGNLDQLLIPLLGTFGYYLFEIVVPFATIALIFLSLREAYHEGERAHKEKSL